MVFQSIVFLAFASTPLVGNKGLLLQVLCALLGIAVSVLFLLSIKHQYEDVVRPLRQQLADDPDYTCIRPTGANRISARLLFGCILPWLMILGWVIALLIVLFG
ncbi:MAG: hypothetical protein JNK85_26730 [Verrucomicrobiales bacterium]|nr:hypothetical protein [Verrucomicrobiales bacterium]